MYYLTKHRLVTYGRCLFNQNIEKNFVQKIRWKSIQMKQMKLLVKQSAMISSTIVIHTLKTMKKRFNLIGQHKREMELRVVF